MVYSTGLEGGTYTPSSLALFLALSAAAFDIFGIELS